MKYLLILLFVAPAAFSQMAPKSVFGEDDRVPMLSHDYPFSAIMRLENTEGGHCTASLVGRDLILTNSHCLSDESGQKKSSIKASMHGLSNFSPTVSVSDIYLGTRDYENDPGHDWAIARIDKPLGDIFGYFNLADAAQIGPGLTLAGFSGDFKGGRTAGVHTNCSLKGIISQHNVMMHDCDMTRGSSGSAIWKMNNGRAVIHALNSAQRGQKDEHDVWSMADSNLSVPVQTFKNQVIVAQNETINHKTEILVCNSKPKRLKLAFGFQSDTTSISKGWVRVSKNSCKFVKLPKVVQQSNESFKVFVYSEDQDLGGSFYKEFCVGGFFGFEKNAKNCEQDKVKLFTNFGNTQFQYIKRIQL